MKRLNILVFAHELSPYQGSECAVGWNIVTRLAQYHNVTVLYAETNQMQTSSYKDAIDDYCKKNGSINGLELIPVSQPKITKRIASFNKRLSPKNTNIKIPSLYYWAYKHWQKEAFRVAKSLIENKKYDIVHQLTGITFREPGYGWKLNTPFVWGPCSGLSAPPFSFLLRMNLKSIAYNLFRRFSNFVQFYFSKRVRHAMKSARQIYAVAVEDIKKIKTRNNSCVGMLDVGAYLQDMPEERLHDSNKIQVLWVGQLLSQKALDILLHVINQSRIIKDRVLLHVVGGGNNAAAYYKLANQLGVNSTILWTEKVPHDQIFHIMQKSDFLVHTSIMEATSAVLLEALSCGLPVICHDAYGMGVAITDKCGMKIPLVSPKKSIEGFKRAIEYLIVNPEEIKKKSAGALDRSKELSWDIMVETIASNYYNILERNENSTN